MYDERYGNWNTDPAEDIFFLPESLCLDINFMSAILGQNTKYAYHIYL
jgi:hypothetical protein